MAPSKRSGDTPGGFGVSSSSCCRARAIAYDANMSDRPVPSPAPDVEGGLRRVLGPVSATCIVVGAIIGVGIFFTPTSVARITGSGHLALWTWVAGGVVALLGALTFAELGGMYGRAGGQYDILRDAYGTAVAFCFVFCNSTAILAGGIAIISMVCAENLVAFAVESVPAASAIAGIAVALIVILAGANFARACAGGRRSRTPRPLRRWRPSR